MKHVLAILPFLALAATGQEDVYQTLASGDRLHVTFRSGGSLIGTLVPPPMAGPAAAQRKKPKAVDVKAPSAPFVLHYFFKKADASSAAQEAILEPWMKLHLEGSLVKAHSEDRDGLTGMKRFKVAALPSVVFEDPAAAVTQAFLGLQSAERLEAGLARLRSKVEEAKIDYSKEEFITLDVSLEYPGLNGTMSLARKDIRDVKKLQKLDEATRRRLEEEHKKIRDSQAADETSRRESETRKSEDARVETEKADKEAAEAAAKADEVKALQDKAAKLKAADELLKQFPPDKWGDEKMKEITQKNAARLPVTPEERTFLEKHKDWVEAVKSKEGEKKEKPPEEGSGEKK